LFPNYNRYSSAQSTEATKLYHQIAHKNGLTLTQLSLAFVAQQQFVTSSIIGATTLVQLQENIDTINIVLPEVILKEINAVHAMIPDPAP
jgi:aryl-alcohol dehydrogenase-like predicted oxidoreductase